jgi:PAS domain S-box-containing protein
MRNRARRTPDAGVRELTRRLDRLCRLAADVAALGSEQATLKRIVDTAASVVGAHAAHVALVDRGRKSLYGVVSSGRHRPDAPRACFELRPGMAAVTALKSRRPCLVQDARRDARVSAAARKALRIGAAAYLPLIGAGQSFGLLILSFPRPHAWTAQERKLATYVASVAAVAIQTSRLLNRLSETDGRLRSLIEDIPAIVYMSEVDFPYRTYYVGPLAESILGYSAQEWVEDPELFIKLVHPDDLQPLVELAERARQGTGSVRAEYRMLDRNGNTRWFRDEAVLVRDPAGKPLAWNGILVEITSIKSIEATPASLRTPGTGAAAQADRPTAPRAPGD